MKNYYITFRSITYAQRGEQILRRAGIDCILRRTPKQMTKRGCGYSLQLRRNAFLPAMERLQAEQLPFGQVYALDDRGVLEEVTL
jgi:hypothetical protein